MSFTNFHASVSSFFYPEPMQFMNCFCFFAKQWKSKKTVQWKKAIYIQGATGH